VTLDEVLQDIKAEYDKATQGLVDTQARINELNQAKQLIEDFIKKTTDDILHSCQGIKSICKGFNFAEEMHILLKQLEASRTLLTDPTVRQTAQTFIDSIKGIIGSLGQQDPKSTVVIRPGSWQDIEFTGDEIEGTGTNTDSSATILGSFSATNLPHVQQHEEATHPDFADSVWCTKCSDYHESLFNCPKLINAVIRNETTSQKPSSTATRPTPQPAAAVTPLTKQQLLSRLRRDSTFHPLTSLTNRHRSSYPEGVDPDHRELYLSDQEFQRVFGMTKEKFLNLPAAHQVLLT